MPMCTTGAGPAAALLGSSGPTVLLNAAYLTDTLLNEGATPSANGEQVDSWATATGGTFNFTRAELAGAAGRPLFITASGVHTNGGNTALTVATPITIPANADCVIYVKVNLGAYESGMTPLGLTTGGYLEVISGDTELGHQVTLALDGVVTNYIAGRLDGSITTGVHLIRLIRASGAWTFAATGTASFSPLTGGTVSGAFSFNTLLARGTGGTLDTFSATGMYLQKAYIFHGSSTPDTTFETNNGGVL